MTAPSLSRPSRSDAFSAWLARPPLWCTLLLCATLLACRRPDLIQTPQLWAEDGPIFFFQSRTMGAAALLQPSAGYLHTVLRVVAWLAAFVDPTLTPALYVGAAGALTLYVAARTQSPRFPLPPSLGYALAVVLVPDASEVLLTLTNLQWVLAGALLLLLISRDAENGPQRWHDFVALLALGLTGPFSIALAPLFVWRAYHRRTRFSTALAAVAAACALVQLAMIYTHPFEMPKGRVALEALLAIPGRRIAGSLLTGGRIGATGLIGANTINGLLIVASVIALALRAGSGRQERTWLGVTFVALLALVLFRCRSSLLYLYYDAGPRYFFVPQLIALWLVIALAVDANRTLARVGLALIAGMFAVNVSRLREPASRDLNWPAYAVRIRSGEQTLVRINPPGWEFEMPGAADAAHARPEWIYQPGMINASARCFVTPEQPATVGFTVGAGPPRKFLVRAVGPSLALFGIERPLSKPTLRLLQGTEERPWSATSRGGSDTLALKRAAEACHAFALTPGAGDFAAVTELEPGTYTAIVPAEDTQCGEVLIEVYEMPFKR